MCWRSHSITCSVHYRLPLLPSISSLRACPTGHSSCRLVLRPCPLHLTCARLIHGAFCASGTSASSRAAAAAAACWNACREAHRWLSGRERDREHAT
jgi:hypothetical protein